ncbi:MAG: hypothetical protein DWB56_15950 [Candidatus Jettenia sp.]|uniref:Phage head morphogenesis domain-containing protein n=1 Tax=Candidatus Jettenia caeni TaxID=247490 RepID=I3IPL6_9BACT|nr:hypothetical protein [Candidatus Jettenia sp. AMX1]MBC6930418.1 hypothetical protein [Candidatus Jettenia sp.]NUN23128.1 hypothetical protein [Candidatus Jettenia caeni]KAA0247360.1 MAG: hypothetical protein EDM77_15305 [Candidatus Jettenia sp. AMX1]MCE7882102.1 hypothetical protein [Candidatus Jettenia sp. AMX1]MCQ3928727.1 hypothetical protein [Candidatus Jettenia sp.]
MTRFIIFFIIVCVIYYLIKNSLKGRTTRTIHQDRRRTYKEAEVADMQLKEIAYVFYLAVKDGGTCDVCMTLDGRYLLPNHKMLHTIKPPHAGCKSAHGCRCTLVYVTRDEEGGREIESCLKRHGGMCDKQTVERELSRGNA